MKGYDNMKEKNKSKPTILNSNHIVQKSRPLLLATDINYTIGQFKVLDTYMSCINSHNPDETIVSFKVSEYENMLGVSRLRTEELQKSLSDLIKLQVTVPFEESEDGFLVCNLFDSAGVKRDEITDEKYIYLKCSETAKPLFFNLDQIGYVRYQLRNVITMKSLYSIYLYQYLKDNTFRSSWKIQVDSLMKDVFRVKTSRYKKDFNRFRTKVLGVAVDEINTKTDISVKCEEVITSGKVTSVVFRVYDSEKERREIERLSNDLPDDWQPL